MEGRDHEAEVSICFVQSELLRGVADFNNHSSHLCQGWTTPFLSHPRGVASDVQPKRHLKSGPLAGGLV
ncbi:hypothetical protein KC19_9G046900 [Ceratodon purpureus]|uniref:Uncharacterized protein n=1 Tax=Ceratodon purpureus TaxID=3225 RepID=A0A8T0GRL3_CERPU|nr:hypothetical protein KC19_9G046900 [Ceratodon purpureus]